MLLGLGEPKRCGLVGPCRGFAAPDPALPRPAGAGLAIGVSGGGGAAARASVRHEILFRPRLDTHKGQQVAAVGGTPPEVTVEVSAVNTAGLPADVRVVCENARTLEFDGGLAKD